jgi:GntR family transcriptional regulator
MDQIKFYVASKTLAAGGQLPSIRELAKTIHVNPTTIVRAYNELEHEGVIEMKHGKGVFVAEGVRAISEQEREAALRRLARQLAVEAIQMGVPESLVLRVIKEEINRMKLEVEE